MDNNYSKSRATLADISLLSESMTGTLNDIQVKMAAATDNLILQQLNEFISRGLIIVEFLQPQMVRDIDSPQIKICQAIRLVLKDQEYIQKLEQRVLDLENTLISSISTTSPVRK